MKNIIQIIFVFLFFITCVIKTNAQNSKYQEVQINTHPENSIFINDVKLDSSKKIYDIKMDGLAKQVVCKRMGYLDSYYVIIQHNRRKYLGSYDIGKNMIKKIKKKTPKDKFVFVDEISADIDANHSEHVKVTYKDFFDTSLNSNLNRGYYTVGHYDRRDVSSKVDIEVLGDGINTFLANRGYIDTNNRVLSRSYSNSIYVNAKIEGYKLMQVYSTALKLDHTGYRYVSMIYNNLDVHWEVFDIYDKKIYEFKTNTQSDYFINNDPNVLQKSIKNSMNKGLIALFENDGYQKVLKDRSDFEKEKNFEVLHIPVPTNIVGDVSKSVKASVTVKSNKGHGSGFFISNDGHIITNYHVISDTTSKKPVVVLNNGKSYEYKVLRVSKINDIAVLKVNIKNEYSFILKNEIANIGEDIFVVGTPTSEDLYQSVSKGIISGIREAGEDTRFIQTDASVNKGNSGGAIINKNGKVVGIVKSKLFGRGIEGVAFGIPSDVIEKKLKIAF